MTTATLSPVAYTVLAFVPSIWAVLGAKVSEKGTDYSLSTQIGLTASGFARVSVLAAGFLTLAVLVGRACAGRTAAATARAGHDPRGDIVTGSPVGKR
jgi:hypothetical protein